MNKNLKQKYVLHNDSKLKKDLLEMFNMVYRGQKTCPAYILIAFDIENDSLNAYICKRSPFIFGKVSNRRVNNKKITTKADNLTNSSELLSLCRNIIETVISDLSFSKVFFSVNVERQIASAFVLEKA